MNKIYQIIFAVGILLHELTHFIVGRKFTDDISFLIPLETSLATQLMKSNRVNQIMMFIYSRPGFKQSVKSKFGVEANFGKNTHAEHVILFALAPTIIFLPILIGFTAISISFWNLIGLTTTSIFGIIILLNMTLIGLQLIYAATPSLNDLKIAKNNTIYVLKHYLS